MGSRQILPSTLLYTIAKQVRLDPATGPLTTNEVDRQPLVDGLRVLVVGKVSPWVLFVPRRRYGQP